MFPWPGSLNPASFSFIWLVQAHKPARGTYARLLAGAVGAGLFAASFGTPSPASAASDPMAGAPARSDPKVEDNLVGDYLSARIAQGTRDLPAAANYLTEVLKASPDDGRVLNRAFLVALSLGRVDAAVEYARKLGNNGGTAHLPGLVLSLQDAKAGHFSEVEGRAATLPQETMQRTIAALLTAWARAGEGRTADALAALDPLGRAPELAPLQNLHAGLIQQLAGDTAAAEASFRKAIERQGSGSFRIADALGRLLEATGRTAEARKLYVDQGNLELAESAVRRIDRGTKPEPLVSSAKDGFAQAMFDLGSVANQAETSDLALLYAWLALDLKPDFQTDRMLLAEILEAERRLPEAQVLYESIPRDSAIGWTARLRGAELLDRMGKTDEAKARLQTLAEEQKDRPEPLIGLGDLLRGHDKFAEAAEAYDRAIARIPTVRPQDWVLLYSRGISLERSGQWPRAEVDFDQALTLQPDQPSVLNYLGYSWIDQNRKLHAALRLIERAVQQRPDDGSIVDSLGWGLYRLNQVDRAGRIMERAVELRPEDSTINAHYGDVLWAQGRRREARFQWSHALTYSPEADQIPSLRARLANGLPPDAAPSLPKDEMAAPTATPAPAPTLAPGNDQKPGRGG